MKDIKLTQVVKCAGCAAKLPPAFLSAAVKGIDWPSSDKVIQDMSGNEDSGVFALNNTYTSEPLRNESEAVTWFLS